MDPDELTRRAIAAERSRLERLTAERADAEAPVNAARAAEVPRLLHELTDTIRNLDQRVAALIGRLAPVSRSEPRPEAELASNPTCTELGAYLENLRRDVADIAQAVMLATDALEL